MTSKRTILFLILASAFALSACTGSALLNASSWPGVTPEGDRIFLAFGPHVYSLNAENGSVLWKYPDEADNQISFYGAPGLTEDGQQLIIGGYDNVLYSLNPDTGLSSGWTYSRATSRYIGSVLVVDGAVYAPNADGRLYALDFSGQPLWQEPYTTAQPLWSAPTTDGSTLYFSSLDQQIHAVDAGTGRPVWTYDLGTASTGTPAILDGTLYVGTFGSRVVAIDASGARSLWEFETNDWVWGAPTVSGNLIIAADISGMVYAIDAVSGTERWRFQAETGVFGSPIVYGERIFFGDEGGRVYALDFEGDLDWFFNLTGKVYNSPVISGENLLVATLDGDSLLTALSLNGAARWSFTPAEN